MVSQITQTKLDRATEGLPMDDYLQQEEMDAEAEEILRDEHDEAMAEVFGVDIEEYRKHREEFEDMGDVRRGEE